MKTDAIKRRVALALDEADAARRQLGEAEAKLAAAVRELAKAEGVALLRVEAVRHMIARKEEEQAA